MTEVSPTRQPRDLLQRTEDLCFVLEAAPVGLFALDLEGRVVLGKGAGGKLVDKQGEGWPGSSVFEMFADHPEIVAVCRRALRGEEFTSTVQVGDAFFESRFAPMRDADGELIGTVAVMLDATERRRAQEGLERQLDLERGLAELSRGFLEVESESIDDAIHRELASASSMAGADRSFLLSQVPGSGEITGVYEWQAEGVPARGTDAITSGVERFPWSLGVFRRGEVLHVARLDEIPPEGEAERVDLAGRGVRSLLGIPVGKGGSRIGYLSFERVHREKGWTEQEVTLLRLVAEIFASALRRKHTEEALRESQAQLLHSQKMGAVGRLAGGIAHDFNNLLTVILCSADAVIEAVAADLEVRADAEEIRASARRAAELTQQLLMFSRRQAVKSQPLAINDVVAGFEKMLERVIGEDVELRIRLAPDAGLVDGDSGQIEQMVANLAVNAREAMPAGGRLEIRTEAVDLDANAAARIGLAAAGSYVLLSVEDTGHGMDEATSGQAFEPFFTTKEVGEGPGLGLSVVYSIVEQAGGTICVRTRRGDGTCFEIYLPTAKDEAELVDDLAASEASAAGGESVLLVEDDCAVRSFMRRILANAGYCVLEAGDGRQALELAERCEAPVRLLISDVVMPGSNGPELARLLQSRWPGLRVLFVSGYPCDHAGVRDESLPPELLLQKPFTHRDLLERVRSLLAVAPPAAEEC